MDEEKKSVIYPYQYYPPHVDMIIFSSTVQLKDRSLNFCISILYLNLLNVVHGKDFVNKSTRLPYDKIYWTSILLSS